MSDHLTKERVEEEFKDFDEDIIIDVDGEDQILTYDFEEYTMRDIDGVANILGTVGLMQEVREVEEHGPVMKYLFHVISENDCDVYVGGDDDE